MNRDTRSLFSTNNFDLIRLFAASQVAISHTIQYLTPEPGPALSAALRILSFFPGVPIFFFISGFLISRSYEQCDSLTTYARNRALRIFPALHVCLILNIGLIALTGYFVANGVTLLQLLGLYAAKGSILQFYNPAFMRNFGDGVLNGSLWTICVELQFYCLVPLYYLFISKNQVGREKLTLVALVAVSLAANRALYHFEPQYAGTVAWKLSRVTFAPWLYMFLIGVFCQQNIHRFIESIEKQSFRFLCILYVTYAVALFSFGFRLDNAVSPLLTIPLFALVLASAFKFPWLAHRLLRKNDISYGVYIYHMPLVNFFLYFGYRGTLLSSGYSIVLSFAVAYMSWSLVERPVLHLKKTTLWDRSINN
jgi:peptidoglycan/LPS O-acetylase OafA/YrhL